MKYKAQIDVMPMQEILDPQGKVVTQSLHNLGIGSVADVRIGKHINMYIEAGSRAEAESEADLACRKLLANPIMETYSFVITEG